MSSLRLPIRNSLFAALLLLGVGCSASSPNDSLSSENEVRIAEARAREAEANARVAEIEARRASEASSSRQGPPDIAGPVLDAGMLRTMPEGGESGCYAEGGTHEVTLVSRAFERQPRGILADWYIIRDPFGSEFKYYVHDNIPHHAKTDVAVILVEGRRMSIQFDQCGNGGSRYLTYIQPLPLNGRP